jgi:SynChlorMet cassette protein ScmC
MNHLPTPGASLGLVLADGSRWEIAAEDEQAASIVSQLGGAMQLRMTPATVEPSFHGHLRRLVVRVDAHAPLAGRKIPLASENGGAAVCILGPCDQMGVRYVDLVRLSLVFAREAQARGGVLMHGALAERDGIGVILAAPGGRGKTTASNRLPAPWRSLCDDTTLVVRDPEGIYRAHPWPTWSRFLDGGPGGTWDVQNAVPVRGIFFLAQAGADRVERVGPGRAASLLGEFVGQVSTFMAPDGGKEEIRALHLERFNNVCALVRAVPTHVLHISLTGAFWQEIERALEGGYRDEARDTIGPDGSC